MFSFLDGRNAPKPRRGPKPRGRKVKPLTIAVTLEQRLALESLADARGTSISEVVRQFIAQGLTSTENARTAHDGHDGHVPAGTLATMEPIYPQKPS